jgi:N-carbamoyl-L-amino-acid hydrolase
MPHTLARLNAATADDAASMLAGLYPGAPGIAARALDERPFATLAQLKQALRRAVDGAGGEVLAALIDAGASTLPKGDTSAERDQLARLAAAYRERHGHDPVLATHDARGRELDAGQAIASLARRLDHPADIERQETLIALHRNAELRLRDAFGDRPALGEDIWDWHEQLSAHSDPGYAERGLLTVTYLTDAHRACARQIETWMRDGGLDEVGIDAVGNVVGRYRAATADAPILLTGSHYDTVRNAGKYDGRLGIFVPMACVRELSRQGRRLPFQIEVVAFAEEEGQRYPATFLGSGALTGDFQPAWLDQVDADGISMREALRRAGLRAEDIPRLRRDPARYLGFIEVHIEQGPVLYELGLPLAAVTSINGCVRYRVRIQGMASHAGTTPMGSRRDAATAAAELLLYVERRAAADAGSVGTVGMLEVPNGSINVVPGECRFSLDLRAPSDAQRDALARDVLAELAAICARRGLRQTTEQTMRASAAPSHPRWQQRWERAIAAQGLPPHSMASGAGHDAMKLHEIMPQAMLFVRGQNHGISHNPLETTTSDDIQLAVQAYGSLLDELARESGN